MIDSFLIINLLGKYAENATSLYGLFSGGVQSVLSLPVSVCYGIAVAAVPLISGVSKKDKGGGAKYAYFAVALTGAFSLVMAAGCFLLPDFIVRVLFFSLSAGEKAVVVKLLKLTAPCIVFMSVLQTVNSVLIGKSRPYAPLFGLGAGRARQNRFGNFPAARTRSEYFCRGDFALRLLFGCGIYKFAVYYKGI